MITFLLDQRDSWILSLLDRGPRKDKKWIWLDKWIHKVIAIDEAQNCWVKRLIQKTHTQFSFCHRATYIDPIGLPMLVSQTPQKMVTPPAPSHVCFLSHDHRQHTLQKKTKSANAKLLRMDLLQWLWLFCEFLAKLQSCYQRHLTVFQRWVHGPIEVMKEATMLNGGQGTKGIFRYNNKNEYKQFASETLGLEDEFPFVKASCQVLCWFQWG